MNKNNVIINGIRYVPVDDGNNVSVRNVRRVLNSQKYLSASAVEDIIGALRVPKHESMISPKSETEKPKNERKFSYNSMHKVLFNIGGTLSNGGVLYKKRVNPAQWNIQQAIVIRKEMNNDSTKGMTVDDVKKIESKVKLSSNLIRKIMYNIEFGNLSQVINDWKVKYIENTTRKSKPMQNNPQKRGDDFEIYS